MSGRTLRLLAIAVVVLFAAVWLVNRQRDPASGANELLFPGLEARLDEVTAIEVRRHDDEVRIVRNEDGWAVPSKGGYAADVTRLRDLLLGLAQAHKVEQKTSNPELYERIGVEDPQTEDASGVLIASEGLGETDFAVILGDTAQGDYRYVRVAGEPTSWLIDKSPEIPEAVTGWLVADVTDIPAARVQSVTIRHDDGDTIRIHKADEDDGNYTVEGIPEGRELSYPSVANGIAAALDNLSLEDVRRKGEAASPGEDPEGDGDGDDTADAAPTRATTVYTTFDGLEVTVDSSGSEDETWISLVATALPRGEDSPPDTGPAAGSGDAPVTEAEAGAEAAPAAGQVAEGGSDDQASGTAAEDDAPAPESGEGNGGDASAGEAPDPAADAAALNARVAGWEYRIPQYKATQLRRTWEDLLRAPDSAEE